MPDFSAEHPTVLAFDPGGTTGWSVLTVSRQAMLNKKASVATMFGTALFWDHGQIDSKDEDVAAEDMLRLCRQYPDACILVEDFIIRMFNQDKEVLSPVRLTAKLDFALHFVGDPRYTFRQQPSEAMGTATDDYLKEIDLYERKGGLGHARDADRHSVLWLRKAHDLRLGPKRRAEWWPHLFG
jgi:hypothetical protein